MERMMGHTDTPVRRILNHAWQTFAGSLPCVFVLTVVGRVGRDTVTRGLFIGDSHDVFERAAALAREVGAMITSWMVLFSICLLMMFMLM